VIKQRRGDRSFYSHVINHYVNTDIPTRSRCQLREQYVKTIAIMKHVSVGAKPKLKLLDQFRFQILFAKRINISRDEVGLLRRFLACTYRGQPNRYITSARTLTILRCLCGRFAPSLPEQSLARCVVRSRTDLKHTLQTLTTVLDRPINIWQKLLLTAKVWN